METIRHVVRGNGRIPANFNHPDINERSVVVITACEIKTVGERVRPTPRAHPSATRNEPPRRSKHV